jgi:hypothetical protein
LAGAVHSGHHETTCPDILPLVLIRPVVVALGAAVALTGCSSDADPRPLPPLPPPSATQAAALPVPPEATPETPQGAAAFARYYFHLLNESFKRGDASGVRQVSDPGCDACLNLIAAIEEEDEPGQRVEGGDYRVLFAESPPIENGDVIVDLRYALTEARVVGSDGGVISTTPANPGINAQLRLMRQNDTWIVRGFRNVNP